MSRILIAVVLIAVVGSFLSIWFYPPMQDFMAGNARWNGIKKFAAEFKAEIPQTMDGLTSALEEPEKKVLILIPSLDYNVQELSVVRNFISDGGTMLLMDDYGYANTILSYLETKGRFSKAPLLDPVFAFKNERLPRIADFAPHLKEAGIEVLMFNHATALLDVPESEAIAWSSEASFLDVDRNGFLGGADLKGPLVVAAQLNFGKGNLILVSDSSIIINSMVGRDSNYDFIKYFTASGSGGKSILIDGVHLSKSPLDKSKNLLASFKKAISNTYSLVSLMALVFAAVYTCIIWGGKYAGR